MGNSIGGAGKTAKVVKIDGQMLKLKTQKFVRDILKDHPRHALLDSEAVKHFGIRAEPLEPDQELKPRRVYFLVELPRFPGGENRATRRVQSTGIQMSAEERLEILMLSRRTSSGLAIVKPRDEEGVEQLTGRTMMVKVRIGKAEMARLVEESRDEVEVAEKIMRIYMGSGGAKKDDMGNARSHTHTDFMKRHVRFKPEDNGGIQRFSQPFVSSKCPPSCKKYGCD